MEDSQMTSKDKDKNCSKARAGWGRGKSKPRHKFAQDHLKILQQLFEKDPYPNYLTKDKLAAQFGCQVCVIENWFQNRRSRLPSKLRGKNYDGRTTPESQDSGLPGHQGTQSLSACDTAGQVCSVETQEASGEQVDSPDSMVQSVRMRSSACPVCYQGAGGSGSSFSLGTTNFTPPPMCEQSAMGNWIKTWYSQSSTSSVFGYVPRSGQGQMDSKYSWLFPKQQQNNWGHQQQQQQPQSDQETSFADRLMVHQSQQDLGQQAPFFLSEHQEHFRLSGDAAGSQMQPAHLAGQQGAANSYACASAGEGSSQHIPEGSPRLCWDQPARQECWEHRQV
ncbi:cytoplasmic polyadenylated homeobox-like [Mesocricetus auratus]|uniref:Cytoplasmic polyadenylated homeobox-like n=1 Tax=Mesocricetus auratus TaxID=10036 RepID=A0A3Q0DHB1_MESAU|nr:cytoplasmic polyadenylated homeobox-like [Mesocricetus auratus]XP_040603788.1 cytoplasmic polyadenylated homeobox-like [Mesocricetus auratus]